MIDFELPQYYPAETKLENIVGNQEAKKGLVTAVDKLLTYDIDTKTNPINNFDQALLLYDRTGTGKTAIIDAACNYARETLEKAGREVCFVDLNSLMMSVYIDGAAMKTEAAFKEMRKGNKLYIAVLDELHLDEIKNTEKYLKIALSQENPGNYLVLTTSTDPSTVSECLKQRFKILKVDEGPCSSIDRSKKIEL